MIFGDLNPRTGTAAAPECGISGKCSLSRPEIPSDHKDCGSGASVPTGKRPDGGRYRWQKHMEEAIGIIGGCNMKKAMLLWPLLLLSAIGCTENNSENDPVVEPNLNPPLTFAVISDVHIGNDVAEGPMVNVPQALKNITSYGELDAMELVEK